MKIRILFCPCGAKAGN
ncbi:expressed protein ilvX [Sodalis praecaptivus]|uniref:Expressed protein ilvX n=1 Tax=Sodalis praecaptivus TaxID=1239307 RepID=W0HNE0_9GAMM|nr:expressed protein ilvX [Sodalis praecaptivus]